MKLFFLSTALICSFVAFANAQAVVSKVFAIFPLIAMLLIMGHAQTGGALGPAPQRAKSINVGSSVLVSKARPNRLHWEPVIASDPDNPKNLLACVIDGEEGATPRGFTAVYSSCDGGKSWQKTLEIVHPKEIVLDPSCALGSGRIAYVTARPLVSPVFRSRDSGRTWTKAADLRLHNADREFITVDTTRGPYHGQVYLHYTGIAEMITDSLANSRGIDLWRSSDSGNKFYGPSRLASKSGLMMGNATILSDGTFTAIAAERGEPSSSGPANSRIVVMQSKGDSRGFTASAEVSKWYSEGTYDNTCIPLPSVSADTSEAFKDRLYAAWSDSRRGKLEIMASHSADKGKTWSPPVVVRDGASSTTGRNSCTPAVAVNKDGAVGVIWYDRLDHPDNKIEDLNGRLVNNVSHETWFSASLDGGKTFLSAVRLSEKIIPKRFRIGETIGLAAGPDGKFHALWIENRTGVPQAYYAPITVKAGSTTK